MKHPKFRVRSVLDLDKVVLDEIEELGKAIIALLPVMPIDIEIVGSYANNSAELHSDLDIAMPCKDWNDQMILRRAFYGINPKPSADIRALIHAFEIKYEIKVDFNPVIPDNKANTTYATYSLYERKLYNKPADLIHFWLKLSPYTQRYILTKYELNETAVNSKMDIRALAQPVKFSSDNFASEVEEWKKIYGDKFLDYKVIGMELSE